MNSPRPTTPRLEGAGWVFLLATWLAFVTAIAELLVFASRKFISHRMIFKGWPILWMTPLSYLLFFVALALVMNVLLSFWPRRFRQFTAACVLAFFSVLSFLWLWYPKIHRISIALLAAGAAVQFARLLVRAPDWMQRLVRRTVPAMAITIAVGAVGLHGWFHWQERGALSRMTAAQPGAPNVLLIVLDTVRARSLGLYGNPRLTTPELDRFSKRGATFQWPISAAPWTLPSHATMFTGRWPHESSADWETPLDGTHLTLAEFLRSHGYATGGFVANVRYCGAETGLSRGFIHYEDYPISAGEVILSSSIGRFITNNPYVRRAIGYYDMMDRKPAADINEAFVEWLDALGPRPFFAFLNYFDAHEPFMPPAPFDTMFGPLRSRGPFVHDTNRAWRSEKQQMTPEDIQTEVDAYEGGIAYMDHVLGRLFSQLDDRGILANTLVIVTADHGEQLGEHHLFGHLNSLYLPLIHVPLVIVLPSRIPEGTLVTQPVSLRDLAATVTDVIGLGSQSPFPGASLSRYWNRDGLSTVMDSVAYSEINRNLVEQEWYPIARGNIKSVVNGHHHYIRLGDGVEELYDLAADSAELNNLVSDSRYGSVLRQVRAVFDSLVSVR